MNTVEPLCPNMLGEPGQGGVPPGCLGVLGKQQGTGRVILNPAWQRQFVAGTVGDHQARGRAGSQEADEDSLYNVFCQIIGC